MIVVRVEVEKELASTEMELEKYRGISADLDSLLNDANTTIHEQEKKIQDIVMREKDLDKQSKKLKAELAVLKKMRDDYLEKIDQLVTENKELKAKNDSLNRQVNVLADVNKSLETKVKYAAELKIEYVKVKSFKKKSSGKLVESSLAKKTNKIDVCFTVMDNKFATTGEKIVYLVITEPTGKVLAGQSHTSFISTDNTEISATASYQINYNGKKVETCIGYESQERILTPGNYNCDLYIDGALISSSQYLLE
jgi:vacuolar-type H+-ATPase subunit I/STV1